MGTRYSNGRIPAGVLQTIATGTDSNGYWEFQISPHTLALWNAAKAYAVQHFGKTLHIRTGWNCYRPYDIQVAARKRACDAGNCNAAASPGYSSHGGTWIDTHFTGGRWVDAMAIDVDPNGLSWAQMWEAATAAGFLCNAITIQRAGIAEPWHIIDLHPWDAVPNNVGPVVPFPNPQPDPTPPQGGTDMYAIKVDGDAARGPVELVAGFEPSNLSDEEFNNYTGGLAQLVNARQYDLALSRWTRLKPVASVDSPGVTNLQAQVLGTYVGFEKTNHTQRLMDIKAELDQIQAAAGSTGVVDPAVIAKAVNDDAAKRMAG